MSQGQPVGSRFAPPDLRFSSPREYATLLRHAHDQALSGAARPNVDPALWASWQRALAGGIDPETHLPPHLHEVADMLHLRREHRLAAVMPALSELLADESASGRHLLVLTNAHGEVLWRVGSPAALRQADGLEFVEGADWSEAGIGTNAISEVVLSGRSAQLFSAQHLVRTHHEWACTASPIRDPNTGQILGVLNVSGPLDTVTADSVRMVQCGVRLAEELLRSRTALVPEPAVPPLTRPNRPTASLPRPTLHNGICLNLFGDHPAVVLANGQRVALSLRRAEILVLLNSRQRGWSAEQLAYEVHGEMGAAATIRIEMHRIRVLAPGLLESHPYRLADAAHGRSDASGVVQKLRNGQVAEALDAYVAPLLSSSGASAVESLRLELNAAMGAAVRASGSAELIKRWCETDMGSTDDLAVDELGRLLGYTDAAFLAFRARSERLDRELGL
ncbi:GAF domain-containing protein [Cryobacterium sp. PH31-O1]|uniref:GAF domain-containing protein n=1 Tax=Cryobacterium sp. PH31-O1 TaxID=3046306 RepID=UPI0024B9D71B|nr:GAF domain-containing protein [Cryobacterium sp. PH31-O1]MDJ0337375.1 transcriptional regulator [Cryobacterium sp. PH31-O1]